MANTCDQAPKLDANYGHPDGSKKPLITHFHCVEMHIIIVVMPHVLDSKVVKNSSQLIAYWTML